ncbi:MAG: hypothetical protein QXQ41_05615 [Candidatus Bathyarchaeia archaeon]
MKLKKGQVLTNREISEVFDVCVCRGIRYKGSLKTGIHHVVLIAAFNKTREETVQNPYLDRRICDNKILYTGEGRFGNQRMHRGNLVLLRQKQEKYPIYVSQKRGPGKYAFIGLFNVSDAKKENQVDSRGKMREVFLFELVEADG